MQNFPVIADFCLIIAQNVEQTFHSIIKTCMPVCQDKSLLEQNQISWSKAEPTEIFMSTEASPSQITRLVPPLTIIALVIMIAGAIYHVATIAPPEAPAFERDNAPAPADYADISGWHQRPAGEREGGWERPWGIDVLWFPAKPSEFLGGWNIPLDWAGIENAQNVPEWSAEVEALSVDVFVPRRRFASGLEGPQVDQDGASALESEDVLSAADHYLANDHLMRGIFVGGTDEGIAAAMDVFELRIDSVMPFDNLFGGIIIGRNSSSDLTSLPDWALCDGASVYPCILDLRGDDAELAQTRVEETLSAFSEWLDAEVPKPAAPLPPFETIELSPINRPEHEL